MASASSSLDAPRATPGAPPSTPKSAAPLEVPRRRRLAFAVHKASSWSSNYVPENILHDDPKDPNSRWSSDSNSPPQFLVLSLSAPAVVTAITFGKFEKSHVCNLKRFKVLGGLDEDNMVELLDGGLKNDASRETFRLSHHTGDGAAFFPCRFLKIVPVQCWGPSFNFSIWHVALAGDDSHETVAPALAWHNEFREKEAIRLCLKHFRQRNLEEAFEDLRRRTGVHLEHETLTALYDQLVKMGNYAAAESMLFKFVEDGLFDRWIDAQQPVARWTALITPDESVLAQSPLDLASSSTPPSRQHQHLALEERGGGVEAAEAGDDTPTSPSAPLPEEDDEEDDEAGAEAMEQQPPAPHLPPPWAPSPKSSPGSPQHLPTLGSLPGCRGGHQMVIDCHAQVIYLFGGWDGHRDLSDFWSYDIATNAWKLISADTERDGGPSPRSCHKMILDSTRKHIFVLGRYLEKSHRDSLESYRGDFYMYDIPAGSWTLITDDTSTMGGPSLIYDHQMCIDEDSRTIYVFGGLMLSVPDEHRPSQPERRYSGFFEYDIPTNTWRKRKDDSAVVVPGVRDVVDAAGPGQNATANVPEVDLRFRSSHSMLFHPGLRKLFVFGGQRKREDCLNDFFSYNVDSDDVEIISVGAEQHASNNSNGNSTGDWMLGPIIPAVGHTQRATIDKDRFEIHVMTGLNKDKDRGGDKTRSSSSSNAPGTSASGSTSAGTVNVSFWIYSILHNRWSCYYRCSNEGDGTTEPRPRYAHQLVFDEVNKIHYMFGGNPGGAEAKNARIRLGDFWKLQFVRPSRKEILRRCRLSLRECQFKEMLVGDDRATATKFLQMQVSEMVDHQDIKERRKFELLASKIFENSPRSVPTCLPETEPKHVLRTELFEHLASFFPEEMTHPRSNLTDLIPYPMDLS